MYYCYNCQRWYCDIICPDCASFLNYECPDCHGKFNTPNMIYGTLTKICPWCGKEMKGV
jgi:hypothetical protein